MGIEKTQDIDIFLTLSKKCRTDLDDTFVFGVELILGRDDEVDLDSDLYIFLGTRNIWRSRQGCLPALTQLLHGPRVGHLD